MISSGEAWDAECRDLTLLPRNGGGRDDALEEDSEERRM